MRETTDLQQKFLNHILYDDMSGSEAKNSMMLNIVDQSNS